MKLKINQSLLSDALKVVSEGTTNNQTLPILTGILLETTDKGLRLFSTDLEIGVETVLECDVQEQGSIVIPHNLFKNYINKLPSDIEITLFTKDNKVTISYEDGKIEFPSYHAGDFPETQTFNSEPIVLQQEELKFLIEKTHFAVSKNNEYKATFTSLKMKTENGNIVTVGTDSFRLSLIQQPLEINEDFDINLPIKIVEMLNKLLENGEIKIYFKNNMVKFEFNNFTIFSRTIAGEYPNYLSIIPHEKNMECLVDKNELKSSVERAALLNESGVITLIFEDDILKIKEYDSQIGSIEENVECEKTGESFSANINSRYITEALRTFDTEEVIIEGIGELKPITIREKDCDWTYILMPVLSR